MISTKEKKPWYRSRTWWFNAVTGGIAFVMLPEVTAILPPEWIKWIAFVNVAGNMVMRSITAGGLSLK